ncbi:hypothetical protein [Streptomyces aureus]|uniref:Uncharacterized protein n=1 Tax=Streptomyces aureus TaxID=193461 RepID=A0ABV4SXJ9_9ACTN
MTEIPLIAQLSEDERANESRCSVIAKQHVAWHRVDDGARR